MKNRERMLTCRLKKANLWLKDKIEEKAEAENRTKNNVIETILLEYFLNIKI